MAINVSFAGSTIYRAGAYSRTEIDLGGGFPLSPTGLVAIFGEADAGAPGADEPSIANNVYSPEGLGAIREKYGSGQIVDAATLLFAPASDGAVPAGAQAVYIYKTNASVRATATLDSSYGTVRAREWGVGGNLVSFKNIVTAETPATHTGSVTISSGTENTGATQTLIIGINGADPITAILDASIAAFATVTAASVLVNDTVTINGYAFTAKAVEDTALGQFNQAAGNTAAATSLAACINASNDVLIDGIVTATALGAVVTVTAVATGVGGNSLTFVSNNGTRLAVTGAGTLTGGVTADRAFLLAAMNSAFTGLTFTASGSNKIVITQNTLSNHHRNGYGRSFQIYATSTSLAAFGFTAGLYTPATEPSVASTLYSSRDLIEETDTLGGNIVLGIGYQTAESAVTAATVTVSATTLTFTVTGGTDTSPRILVKANYPTLWRLMLSIPSGRLNSQVLFIHNFLLTLLI